MKLVPQERPYKFVLLPGKSAVVIFGQSASAAAARLSAMTDGAMFVHKGPVEYAH